MSNKIFVLLCIILLVGSGCSSKTDFELYSVQDLMAYPSDSIDKYYFRFILFGNKTKGIHVDGTAVIEISAAGNLLYTKKLPIRKDQFQPGNSNNDTYFFNGKIDSKNINSSKTRKAKFCLNFADNLGNNYTVQCASIDSIP
ncbi:MAG: hypothetical protein MAG795_00441 [Candidatus Woesearchaeota archaeon]|nr:hypothetical protein [Candidatus Woesearchaeota archaeon]